MKENPNNSGVFRFAYGTERGNYFSLGSYPSNIIISKIEKSQFEECFENLFFNPPSSSLHFSVLHESEARILEKISTALKNNDNSNDLILEQKDNLGRTLLDYAVSVGKLKIVEELINLGCNVNSQDKNGVTPLHDVVLANVYSQDIRTSICQKLIENSADLNIQDKSGNTPLHFACQYGEFKIANLFLENGADYQIKNKNHLTAVQLSFYAYKENSAEGKKEFYDLLSKKEQLKNKLIDEQSELIENYVPEPQINLDIQTNINPQESLETIGLVGEQKLDVEESTTGWWL